MLQGIKCYNSDNILILVSNVSVQAKEVGYDLKANLTLLNLNQFNNELQNIIYVEQILLLAVTNLRHSDCIICKSLLSQEVLNDLDLSQVEEKNFISFTVSCHSAQIVFNKFLPEQKNSDVAQVKRHSMFYMISYVPEESLSQAEYV
jgi:hypothetical protein